MNISVVNTTLGPWAKVPTRNQPREPRPLGVRSYAALALAFIAASFVFGILASYFGFFQSKVEIGFTLGFGVILGIAMLIFNLLRKNVPQLRD